jgi:hypothetical protein
MKRVLYYALLTVLTLSIPLWMFAIVNTYVSIKYETEDGNSCISLTSGDNLCLAIWLFRGLILICVVSIITLLYFRKRILK